MARHHHHSHNIISGKNLLLSIFLNLAITIAQAIGGFISGSLALISDAVHNFSDVISLIISYVANSLARNKKQTTQKTFGYKRAEIIAAFVNAISLIVIAIFLGIEAIKRFITPQNVESNLVIILAIIGILVNGFSVLLLQKDAKDNINMKSAYLHLLVDMLTSVAVLIGGILMKFYQIFWIDATLTLLISVYLIYISWDVLKESLEILMQFAPKNINIHHVVKDIKTIKEIKNIHHVHLWRLNDHDTYFEAHIELKEDLKTSQFDEICKKIEKKLFKKHHIIHTNLQPEYKRKEEKQLIIQD